MKHMPNKVIDYKEIGIYPFVIYTSVLPRIKLIKTLFVQLDAVLTEPVAFCIAAQCNTPKLLYVLQRFYSTELPFSFFIVSGICLK